MQFLSVKETKDLLTTGANGKDFWGISEQFSTFQVVCLSCNCGQSQYITTVSTRELPSSSICFNQANVQFLKSEYEFTTSH